MQGSRHIEVAYATPTRQMIIECQIEPGTSPRNAVRLSGIHRHFLEIDLDHCDLGVFGKLISEDYELQDGDRIEIYRPLIADPKEIRRQRAACGLKTGKGGGALSQD
jgi:putative ubiquitin-RnfH superfamily antitoxin RatB of RatAB toxin-antitoxin module